VICKHSKRHSRIAGTQAPSYSCFSGDCPTAGCLRSSTIRACQLFVVLETCGRWRTPSRPYPETLPRPLTTRPESWPELNAQCAHDDFSLRVLSTELQRDRTLLNQTSYLDQKNGRPLHVQSRTGDVALRAFRGAGGGCRCVVAGWRPLPCWPSRWRRLRRLLVRSDCRPSTRNPRSSSLPVPDRNVPPPQNSIPHLPTCHCSWG